MSDDIFSKKCDICGEHQAILFFRTFNADHIGEEGLCPKCALKRFSEDHKNNLSVENEEVLKTINHMRHILSDIVGHINKSIKDKEDPHNPSDYCSLCQTSISNLKQKHQVGCSSCYQVFAKQISSTLQHTQYNLKHKGQIPARHRQEYLKTIELEKLTTKLQSLLRTEAYEEAAKVQKRIQKIKSSRIHN